MRWLTHKYLVNRLSLSSATHPWEAIFTKAIHRRLPVGGGKKVASSLGSPHRYMHGLRNESRTWLTLWWSLRDPESLPPSPASPAHWPTEGNWGFLVQWFKSGSNLSYSRRWLMCCVGSSSLAWFTWIHLIFYVLPFFFFYSLSPMLGDFLLGFSQGQADLQTPASFPTEWGWARWFLNSFPP